MPGVVVRGERKNEESYEEKKCAPHQFNRPSRSDKSPTPVPEDGARELPSKQLQFVGDDEDIYGDSKSSSFHECDIHESFLVFRHPFTCLIAGPTSSGKTMFTIRLITHREQMIRPKIDEILWFYGIETAQLANLKNDFPGLIKFQKGLPDLDKLSRMDRGLNRLLIIDDLMTETRGNTITNLFSKGAHHLNLSVIYIVQNMFNQNKEMRNIFLNAQYKVLFSNPSDLTQLSVLNSRMYPGHPHFLKRVMDKARAKKRHAHVVLDLHPSTPDDLRVWTDIFPGDDNIVYTP